MPKRQLEITVTEDGTIRTETGGMEGIGHHNVDTFLKAVGQGLKSEPVVTKLKPNHTHSHNHTHDHKHIKE